jgi:hypothetical protein
MKKALMLVGLLVGSISAMANDNSSEYYLGMGMASGSGTYTESVSKNIDGTYTESVSKNSYDSLSMPIKFGMMLDNDNRFEFSYETEKYKFTGADNKASGLNFDWNFAYPKYKIADAVTPYWTLGLGLYTYENIANQGVVGSKDDLSGTAFNYGIGGLYDINKNIELEASYKFKAITWRERKITFYTNGIETSSTTTTSDSTGSLFYLGLNYKL